METRFCIRAMDETHIPTCARIIAETELWRAHYGITYPTAEALLREGQKEGNRSYVALEGSAVVGFVWFSLRAAFHRSGYIRLIAVKDDHRGQGIGTALLREAETLIFAHSDHVFLLVSDFNHAAQAVYRRLGYMQVGAIPDYVIPGITELVLCKRRSSSKDEQATHR